METETPQSKPCRKGWRLGLNLLMGALATGGLAWYFLRPAEPTYQGKTAAQWFAQARRAYPQYWRAPTPAFTPVFTARGGAGAIPVPVYRVLDTEAFRRDPAVKALHALGTNAAIYLGREYAREDGPIVVQYGKFFAKLSPSLRRWLPQPPESRYAVRFQVMTELEELGDDAAPAVPFLLRVLRRGDESTVMMTLGLLVRLRFDRSLVEPVLNDWSRSGKHTNVLRAVSELQLRTPGAARCLARVMADVPGLRQECLMALLPFGERGAVAAPEVITALGDTDSETRYRAARALEAMGKAASTAKPALMQATQDPSTMVNRAAARALRIIEGKDDD